MLLTLGFHRVETFTGFEITRLSPYRFSRIVEMIEESGEPVLPPDTSLDGEGVLLTFDDGMAPAAQLIPAPPALAIIIGSGTA